ncbi:hypothetical protein BGZ54_005246 [Gamsiella multidivaricata]|nr:hypothetical protein BGZ54_005246 [Gamsiella multidivaricata]
MKMESVHPFQGLLNSNSSVPKRQGIPIDIPTTQPRFSHFSVQSPNSALMTGSRDRGIPKRKSSTSSQGQGHMSPPYSGHSSDFDVVGHVAGYGKMPNEKGKVRSSEVLLLSDEDEKRVDSIRATTQNKHIIIRSPQQFHSLGTESDSKTKSIEHDRDIRNVEFDDAPNSTKFDSEANSIKAADEANNTELYNGASDAELDAKASSDDICTVFTSSQALELYKHSIVGQGASSWNGHFPAGIVDMRAPWIQG